MPVYKCKMCGGSLEINANESTATCEYCGATQTIPKTDDDIIGNLFNRANTLRLKSEFDKAEEIYNKIITTDNTQAEAYWGIILCKYGIEYVEDPATFKRVPTCHRTSFEAITADEDYKLALQYADTTQKVLYEEEAKAIDEIQKGILAISQNEKPYDVFICYKETDENGKRTNDSVIANDIYHQLTQEGFKVFYAAITLEDKLGQEYEPYIFAALNSAKVMLVIGSKPEYFNAVWVKNEWSRFMKLMKSDRSKLLIPCFKDMDAYELPEEFAHLQAQDMSKIGFILDLVRGVGKIIPIRSQNANQTVSQQIAVSTSNISSLLERAFIFLEDENWNSADEYAERVLDVEPRNADAYLVKLMIEFQLTDIQDIRKYSSAIADNKNYQRILKYGKAELVSKIEELVTEGTAKDSLIRVLKAIISNSLTERYSNACELLKKTISESECYRLAKEFESIKDYKDSTAKIEECKKRIAELEEEKRLKKEKAERDRIAAEKKKKRIIAIIMSAAVCVAFVIVLNTVIIPLNKYKKYNSAISMMNDGRYDEAIAIFTELGEYSDSESQINNCKNMQSYDSAVSLMNNGNYDEAIATFSELGTYMDSAEKITEISEIEYAKALSLMNNGEYPEAVGVLCTIRNYKDSENLIPDCISHLPKNTISAGGRHTVGLKSDGTVVAIGRNKDGQCNVSDWKDIIAVSAASCHTVGLKSDGTVVATGYNSNGQCNVWDWNDIIAVSAGNDFTLGLKSDGTVVATGYKRYGQCDVSDWKYIIAVSAGWNHTVGLKSDGTVVATGANNYGQCNVSNWNDIIAVSAGSRHTVGLKSNGTVVATGANDDGQCNVWDWNDIIAVSAGFFHTVGLKSDGTVVATGYNASGQCYVSDWEDIISVSAGVNHTVGLKSDGTVVATGANDDGQRNVSDWKDIKTTND